MSIRLKCDANAGRRTLVEFSNGIPKADSTFECSVHNDKRQDNPKFRQRKLLVVQGPHLKYVGNNFEDREQNPNASRYVIMEVDKKRGIGQVFETDCYKLKPFKETEDIFSEEEREKTEKQLAQDERSFTEKQDDLTEVFGSHKRKRAMVSRLRNQVADSTDAVQNSVEQLLQDPNLSALVTDDESELDSTIIPCNKTAETVEDVYPLVNFFPDNVSRSLIEEAAKFIHTSSETLNSWKADGKELGTKYIIEHARRPTLGVVQNPQVYIEYSCCLQLMVYLIRLYKIKSTEYRKKDILSEIIEPVRSWILSEFFLNGAFRDRKMPLRMKDKVLAVAIVLAWHIDSFTTDGTMIKEAFSISQKKLSTHVRALGGCVRPTSAGGVKRDNIILQLPLQFPNTTFKGRGKAH